MANIIDTLSTTTGSTTNAKIIEKFRTKGLIFADYQSIYTFTMAEWDEIITVYYKKEWDKKFGNGGPSGTLGLDVITKALISLAIAAYLNKPAVVYKPRSITSGTKVDASTQATIQKNLVTVYPEDTMSYEHPLGQWMSIQFRTSFTDSDITHDTIWEELVFNPNTFFQSFELDDNKGIKRINIELIDQYYTKLENILQKCIVATQLSNKVSGSENKSSDSSNAFDFIINTASFVNMRVRFGYTNDIKKTEDYIDGSSYDAFNGRISSKKPVLRSPWILFQILSIKQSFSDEGLRVSLSAISSSNSFFNKAKMVKKFSVIRGTALNILKDISESFKSVSAKIGGGKGGISFYEFADTQEKYYKEMKVYSQPPLSGQSIEVQLGDKPKLTADGKEIETYKTVREMLDDIVSKIPPLKIMPDGTMKETYEDEETTGDEKFSSYQYVVEEQATGANIIRFYYTNPDSFFMNGTNGLIYLRTYFWRETGNTVVKNISIQTETDFAQMNMTLMTVDASTGGKKIKVLYNNGGTSQDASVDLGVAGVKDGTAVLDSDDFDFSFVSNAENTVGDGRGSDMTSLVVSKFRQNINNSVFRGTIELMGDPFYLFDSVMQPFQYLIKLVIMRPAASMTSKYVDQASPENSPISYMSGFYTITNIKHKMGLEGFSTTLEVMRWPSLFKAPTPTPAV